MQGSWTRREVIGATTALGVTAVTRRAAAADSKPALLGGTPTHKSTRFPSWPIVGENDIKGLMDVLKSGLWNRLNGPVTPQFEKAWAQRLGAKHALATANGTSALFTSLSALGIGPGDEVIVPTYTFAATVNAVFLVHALPVSRPPPDRDFQELGGIRQ